MLLLIFSGCYGTLLWAGPVANRTCVIEPEFRRAVVV